MADPPFDPEGDGYDYATAREAGLKPQEEGGPNQGHWQSRDPRSGMQLKGRAHHTYGLAVEEDKKMGYEQYKGSNGRYYSLKRDEGQSFSRGGLVKGAPHYPTKVTTRHG